MLGVDRSAYQDACEIIAATVIACILEGAGHINSAGGCFRELGHEPSLRVCARSDADGTREGKWHYRQKNGMIIRHTGR